MGVEVGVRVGVRVGVFRGRLGRQTHVPEQPVVGGKFFPLAGSFERAEGQTENGEASIQSNLSLRSLLLHGLQ